MSNLPAHFSFEVHTGHAGMRLDSFIASEIENCSRSFATSLIREGAVMVDGHQRKPGYAVKAGERVQGQIPVPDECGLKAEEIPLNILFEDRHMLIVNKDPGIVVHPSPGHQGGTLVNALMHHCPDLEGIAGSLRPGIVHRLDKDTSGAIVVAKTNRAMASLSDQFRSRAVSKKYLALVYGEPGQTQGFIDLPIGRHPQERKRMSVHSRSPRSALTLWKIIEAFGGASLLELDIRTGRTHQIRVHCHAMGHPVVGDPVYIRRGVLRQIEKNDPEMAAAFVKVTRQMLHAHQLTITHPENGLKMTFTASLPVDMERLIGQCRH